MPNEMRLKISGIDRIDAMELRELLAEHGASAARLTEERHQPLGPGRLGSPDLMDLAIKLGPYVVTAVSTAITLWITRKRHSLTTTGIELEIDGDQVAYRRFDGKELTEISDAAEIEAVMKGQQGTSRPESKKPKPAAKKPKPGAKKSKPRG
jgi:hypothetical protein